VFEAFTSSAMSMLCSRVFDIDIHHNNMLRLRADLYLIV